MEITQKPVVRVTNLAELRALEQDVKQVTLEERGKPVVGMLRRAPYGTKVQGFYQIGTAKIAEDIFLPPSTVVMGESEITGEIRVGENATITNCKISGVGRIGDGAILVNMVVMGASDKVRIGSNLGVNDSVL